MFLNIYAVCLLTISVIPFYNIFIAVTFCFKNSPITENFECYNGFYYVHFSIGILGILITSFFAILAALIYIDTNLNSKIPFAAPGSKLNIIKLFIKIILTIYYTVFYTKTFHKYMVFVILILFSA